MAGDVLLTWLGRHRMRRPVACIARDFVVCAILSSVFCLLIGQPKWCIGHLNADTQRKAKPGKTSAEDEGWITFLSNRSRQPLLYRMRPDGSDVQIIFGRGPSRASAKCSQDLEPHWTRLSPNAKQFLCWATEDQLAPNVERSFAIYLGDISQQGARVGAAGAAEEFCWNPSGDAFAYAIQVNPPDGARPSMGILSTTIMTADTRTRKHSVVLTKPGLWHVQDWSPDGRFLLLLFRSAVSLRYGTTELIELDLQRASKSEIWWKKNARNYSDAPPSWPSSAAIEQCMKLITGKLAIRIFETARYSPDGKLIGVIVSRHFERDEGNFQPNDLELAVLDRANKRLKILAKYPEGLRGPICWSPNGREILFSRYMDPKDPREFREGMGEPGLGIWAIDPETQRARFVTTGWCPDWR